MSAPRTRRKPPPPITEDSVPHDVDAEKAVLGAILVDGRDALRRAAAILTPEDFFDARHRVIFQAMLALHDAGVDVDPVTLTARLREVAP